MTNMEKSFSKIFQPWVCGTKANGGQNFFQKIIRDDFSAQQNRQAKTQSRYGFELKTY